MDATFSRRSYCVINDLKKNFPEVIKDTVGIQCDVSVAVVPILLWPSSQTLWDKQSGEDALVSISCLALMPKMPLGTDILIFLEKVQVQSRASHATFV